MAKSKTLALAISAIQNLKEVRGSTSRDIVNYIKKAYEVDEDTVKKQVERSLKRGVAHGILKRENGLYTFPMETLESACQEIAVQEIGLIEACSRKRGKRTIRKSVKCRGSNCKKCGKSCPCAGSNSSCSENRKNRNSSRTAASMQHRKNKNSENVEKLFNESFEDLKRHEKRNPGFY